MLHFCALPVPCQETVWHMAEITQTHYKHIVFPQALGAREEDRKAKGRWVYLSQTDICQITPPGLTPMSASQLAEGTSCCPQSLAVSHCHLLDRGRGLHMGSPHIRTVCIHAGEQQFKKLLIFFSTKFM